MKEKLQIVTKTFKKPAQSPGAVKYDDCIFAEW